MGRPVNKRFFGVTAEEGQDLLNEQRFTVLVRVGNNPLSDAGIIIRQQSETKFIINDRQDKSGNQGSCTLVNKEIPGPDEFVILGYSITTGEETRIRKITNRVVIDFNNIRYTWEIQDDSSANILILVPTD